MHDAARVRPALALTAALLGFATATDVAAQALPARPSPAAQLPANKLPLLVAAQPVQVRPDLSIAGLDVETLDDGHHVTVRVGFSGSTRSLPFSLRVGIEKASAERVAEQTLRRQPAFDAAPTQLATRDIALLFSPRLPPGTYTAVASIFFDGQDANQANDTGTERFVVPGPPDLRDLSVEADFEGEAAALVVRFRNAGTGEARQVTVHAEIDLRRTLDADHGPLAAGESTMLRLPLPADLEAGSHAVSIVVTPVPADGQPGDNTLAASFDVPRVPWWPWAVVGVVAAAAVGLRARTRRSRAKTPAVVTVRGVPGACSARVEPPGSAPPGFTLRWVADRGTARVVVPGPPEPDRSFTEAPR